MSDAAQSAMSSFGTVGLIGASGLIGGGFRLQLEGHRVITFGRSRGEDRWLDLESPPTTGVFTGIDTLIHAGGIRDEDVRHDATMAMRRADDRTRALYRAALDAGVRRFIHVSSAHVYGSLDRIIDENTPPAPSGVYATAHLASEAALADQLAEYGATAVAVRPNAVYGMTFDPSRFIRWSLVPFAFPRAALAGEIQVNAPRVLRNFVSTGMIARQSLALLDRLGQPGLVPLNTIGPDDLSMMAFAEQCAMMARSMGLGNVQVIAGDNTACPPFAYRSLHAQPSDATELPEFLSHYLAWLARSRDGVDGRSTTTHQRGFA